MEAWEEPEGPEGLVAWVVLEEDKPIVVLAQEGMAEMGELEETEEPEVMALMELPKTYMRTLRESH